MAARATLLRDVLYFIKNDLISNITDPIQSSRSGNSKFVMTSYPQRNVKYPLITVKATNIEAFRAGMQTEAMDVNIILEIRIWARNQKEKDTIYTDVLDRLADIQYTASTGSIANDIHDFNVLSSVEVDEEGARGVKSRVMQVQYRFFNIN